MRLHRTALAGIALGALLPVSAAEAATGVTPAGRAISSATLAKVSVGSLLGVVEATEVSLGSLTASAGTMSPSAPQVTFVPLTLNGARTGAVTVTPKNSPQNVGAVSTGDLGVLAATSPGATLKAADGAARSSSLTSSLGGARLLGLPITLKGGVGVASVTDRAHAEAAKTLTIEDVSLPNVADLLAALGLDMAKLPQASLNALVSDLSLTISQATQQAIDAANAAIDTAAQADDAAQDAVAAATTDLAAKTAALDAALSGATIPDAVTLPEGVTAPLDSADWAMLTTEVQTVIEAANTGLAATADAFDAAKAALAAATNTALARLDDLNDAIAALAGIVEGILAGVPLVEIGAADIGTKAYVAKSKEAAVTGTISGVKVIGNDVLAAVTGDSTLDVAAIAGQLAGQVNAAIATVTGALSNALSSATGATGLVIPAPKVEVMAKRTSTGTDGAFGLANASVTALKISLGSATVPAAYALDDAAGLPGLAAVTGGFRTAPMSVEVGRLSEAARFRPGAAERKTAKPGSGSGGTHPATGGPAGLAIVAVIGAASAAGVRRRLRAQ